MSKQRSSSITVTTGTAGTTSSPINQNVTGQTALLIVLGCLSHLTMAAGFETEASNMMTTVRHAIYVIVGLAATIIMVWQCALGWSGRKGWMDIMETSIWVVCAGAGISFATWLFTKGGSITF